MINEERQTETTNKQVLVVIVDYVNSLSPRRQAENSKDLTPVVRSAITSLFRDKVYEQPCG